MIAGHACDTAKPHLYTPLLMPLYTHSFTSSMVARMSSGYRSSLGFEHQGR